MELVNDKPIYALKNGAPVSIEDVPSGLACECVCPACKWPLVAKKGEIRTHHFAHYQKSTCGYDYLYSLYLLAEKILRNQNKIYVPDIDVYSSGRFVETIQKGFQLPITNIERKDGKKPELFVYYKERSLQVKLLKSSRSINKLKNEMTEIKQAAIGIDVSEIDVDKLEEQLKKLLLGKTYKKFWLYSPKAADKEERIASNINNEVINQKDDKSLPKIKEEIFCRSTHEPSGKIDVVSSEQHSKKNDKEETVNPKKVAEELKSRLINARAKELMLLGVKQGKSIEERDPRITLQKAKDEYNAGLSDWAKEAKAMVDAELSKTYL